MEIMFFEEFLKKSFEKFLDVSLEDFLKEPFDKFVDSLIISTKVWSKRIQKKTFLNSYTSELLVGEGFLF